MAVDHCRCAFLWHFLAPVPITIGTQAKESAYVITLACLLFFVPDKSGQALIQRKETKEIPIAIGTSQARFFWFFLSRFIGSKKNIN
jgi:hypothetical protein